MTSYENFKKAKEGVNCIHLVPPSANCKRPHCVVPNVGEGDCHVYLEKGNYCAYKHPLHIKMIGVGK